jgi:hypothetical protein
LVGGKAVVLELMHQDFARYTILSTSPSSKHLKTKESQCYSSTTREGERLLECSNIGFGDEPR